MSQLTSDPSALVQPFHLMVYSDAQAHGGAEVTLVQMLGGLPDQVRVSVVVANSEVGDFFALHRPSAVIHQVSPISGRSDVKNMAAHRRLFRSLRPDIIQFNLTTMSSCQWAIAVAATLRKVKLIAVENSSMGAWSRSSARLKRLTSRRLGAHLAVGEKTCRIVEDLSGLQAGSVQTMYHGVNPAHFTGPSHPNTIVNVARHDPVKGIDVLLDAVPFMSPQIKIHQIGMGELLDLHRAQAERLGVSDRVTFLQPAWDTRVADLLEGYELFVLPSRTEGLPVSIMEAMLAGLPVVVSDVGSVREEVIDGVTGLVISAEDPQALAVAVNELMADAPRRDAMGAAARARGTELFSVDATVGRYCTLYRHLLDGTSLRTGSTVGTP